MARFILLIVLFLLIARTFWKFIDAIVRGASAPRQPQGGTRPGGQSAVKMSQCPVCGTYVVPGKAISIVSGGSPVYFDSEKCRAEYQSR
ncbi:MAG TPA: hypothetical protein VFZ31_00345 [Vicinamibacterales bacterium]